jgi:hypothetical protein
MQAQATTTRAHEFQKTNSDVSVLVRGVGFEPHVPWRYLPNTSSFLVLKMVARNLFEARRKIIPIFSILISRKYIVHTPTWKYVKSTDIEPFPNCPALDGYHCQTNSLANIYHHYGHPLTEERLLGLGSGMDFMYWHQKGQLPFIGARGARVKTCLRFLRIVVILISDFILRRRIRCIPQGID